MDRLRRLANALRNETAKRLPYILLIFIVLSVIGGFKSYHKISEGVQIAKDNSMSSKTLLQKVASLSEDNKRLSAQNKVISTQNNQLAQQNAKHIDCIAGLLAQYTRDQKPVLSVDLDNCSISSLAVSWAAPEFPDVFDDNPTPATATAVPPTANTTAPPPPSPVAASPPPPNPQVQAPNFLNSLLDGTIKTVDRLSRGAHG